MSDWLAWAWVASAIVPMWVFFLWKAASDRLIAHLRAWVKWERQAARENYIAIAGLIKVDPAKAYHVCVMFAETKEEAKQP